MIEYCSSDSIDTITIKDVTEYELRQALVEVISIVTNKVYCRDVGKTLDGRTSVTVKMGKTRDRTVRDKSLLERTAYGGL